ncbi:hypothetical protein L3Q82_008832 [Scortum barcoo]|uniref:Uncharacterized protein n=1 Tax=Scortum barcoo TaxID=214431 RepID=A0ACB8XCL1_9TELE|nr:hypothetical protein L3Q82_008832 [Scortum barcoo]
MSLGWPGNASGVPPEELGGSVWGEGSLGISAQTAASATRSRTKRMKKKNEEEDACQQHPPQNYTTHYEMSRWQGEVRNWPALHQHLSV